MERTILQRHGANSFGFEALDDRTGKKRRNPAVIRGNGTLTLTENEVHFERIFPPEDIRIPVDLIEWTGIARAHNGKSFGFLPVLQIAFRAATETRVFGVCVGMAEETEEWRAALERLIAARTPYPSRDERK